MTIIEAIRLIQPAESVIANEPQIWADLGCGSGIFTQALAHLLPAKSLIHAIDRKTQTITPVNQVDIQFTRANFDTDNLPVKELDGILMANSLHYLRDKQKFLQDLEKYLKDRGKFILIEYDTNSQNPWVPYPIKLISAIELFRSAGYTGFLKLGERPSLYGKANLYAVSMWK